MQRRTPLRNSNTCTPDILTWPESSPPVPATGNRSRQQPSDDNIGEVLRGDKLTREETRSLAKKKQCSGYRMKEMIEGGIYSDNAEGTTSSIRVYQQAMNGISQISFNTEEITSPTKLVSLPEEAKQRELGGTLQNEPEAESRKQMSSAKTKEFDGNDIFGPPTEIVPQSLLAACILESKENKDLGEHVPQHLDTSIKVSSPAGGQSNILFGEEPVKKTSKKMHDQKFAEMTGNNIFKGDVTRGSAGKPLTTARHREMAGSDIFADGKAENRSHILGTGRQMAGSDIFADGKAENRSHILGTRRQMAGSDIFGDGKAENRSHILGARRPPGGGSSIILD